MHNIRFFSILALALFACTSSLLVLLVTAHLLQLPHSRNSPACTEHRPDRQTPQAMRCFPKTSHITAWCVDDADENPPLPNQQVLMLKYTQLYVQPFTASCAKDYKGHSLLQTTFAKLPNSSMQVMLPKGVQILNNMTLKAFHILTTDLACPIKISYHLQFLLLLCKRYPLI